MVLNRYLLDRLCSCLFLCGSDHALEEAFLFLRSGFGLAVQSLDIQYIDTADNGLYFLFHGNTFEDEWNSDSQIYWKILEADPEQIRFKSRLLTMLKK